MLISLYIKEKCKWSPEAEVIYSNYSILDMLLVLSYGHLNAVSLQVSTVLYHHLKLCRQRKFLPRLQWKRLTAVTLQKVVMRKNRCLQREERVCCEQEASEELLHSVISVMAIFWVPWKRHMTSLCYYWLLWKFLSNWKLSHIEHSVCDCADWVIYTCWFEKS